MAAHFYETQLKIAIFGSDTVKLAQLLNENSNNISEFKWLLNVAIHRNSIEMVSMLLGKGLDINTEFYITPLQTAVINHNANMLLYLLDKGADINYKNSQGNTVLHTILITLINIDIKTPNIVHIITQLKQMFQILMERNPDVNIKNMAGKSAADLAFDYEDKIISLTKDIL